MPDKEPDAKDDLLELIKKFWLPVAGFLSAVTLAYNFYLLWLGDRTRITWIAIGSGLFTLVVILLQLGFSHKLLRRGQREVVQPRYSLMVRVSAFVLLGLVLVGVGVGVWKYREHIKELEAKYIVVVANFDGPEDTYGIHNEIIEEIRRNFSDSVNIQVIALSDVITPDMGSDYAVQVGEEYYADMVIWGWYRPTQNPNVNIHFEFLGDSSEPAMRAILPGCDKISSVSNPSVNIAELDSFSFQQQLGSETTALIDFIQGVMSFADGDFEKAVYFLSDSLENIDPQDPIIGSDLAEIYYYRAGSKYNLGDYDGAIEDFGRSLELRPNVAVSHDFRGLSYYQKGEYDQALNDFTIAIQINPNSADFYNHLGIIYLDREEYQQAEEYFNKSLKINPDYRDAHYNLGALNTNSGDYETAISEFDIYIRSNPGDKSGYLSRGKVYSMSGDTKSALADINKALELDANYADAYYTRALIYGETGNKARAEQDYTRTIGLDRQHVCALNNRGLIY